MIAQLFASDLALITMSALLGLIAGVVLTSALAGAFNGTGGSRSSNTLERGRTRRNSDRLRHDPEFR
ncbi:hypothetical protein [Sandarakinorhabdus sp.]|uniref:hypothetical protein n=1 Tax=Sandarakinorhabdus sp. TaxID=1916663 RepID=UPI00286DC188|nr:hypothetical protein [Sandarakinorhabdus sp.]